jgi:hypothetical protein
MDVWIAINPENAEKLVTVLKEFGFDVPNLSPELFLEKGKITRMGVPPMRLEILTTISGVSFFSFPRGAKECLILHKEVSLDY